ncbi:hypothetical protein J6590_052347 [Homalodisca vitripennis]|nr:hypothetical protein J6590_052347 [Homalodisca vitripennis]
MFTPAPTQIIMAYGRGAGAAANAACREIPSTRSHLKARPLDRSYLMRWQGNVKQRWRGQTFPHLSREAVAARHSDKSTVLEPHLRPATPRGIHLGQPPAPRRPAPRAPNVLRQLPNEDPLRVLYRLLWPIRPHYGFCNL